MSHPVEMDGTWEFASEATCGDCGRTLRSKSERDMGRCASCEQDREEQYEGHEHCDPERQAQLIDRAMDEEDFDERENFS